MSAPASASAPWAEWIRYHNRIADRLPTLSSEELALRATSDGWPVWAILAHMASARVYWLCSVLGGPGADSTPFADPSGEGWEGHLDVPRSGAELIEADASTWQLVIANLEAWSDDDLDHGAVRMSQRGPQVHSRRAVIVRLVSHEAFHAGEISTILVAAGRPPLDLWPAAPPPEPPYPRPG